MSEFDVELPNNRPLLALILHREGALSDQQIDRALRAWQSRRLEGQHTPFGQVVLSLGMLSAEALAPYLALQRALAAPPSERKRLGVLILENGLLRPTQLWEALKRQRETRRPLGQVLVSLGLLRPNQVEILLRFQGRVAS